MKENLNAIFVFNVKIYPICTCPHDHGCNCEFSRMLDFPFNCTRCFIFIICTQLLLLSMLTSWRKSELFNYFDLILINSM